MARIAYGAAASVVNSGILARPVIPLTADAAKILPMLQSVLVQNDNQRDDKVKDEGLVNSGILATGHVIPLTGKTLPIVESLLLHNDNQSGTTKDKISKTKAAEEDTLSAMEKMNFDPQCDLGNPIPQPIMRSGRYGIGYILSNDELVAADLLETYYDVSVDDAAFDVVEQCAKWVAQNPNFDWTFEERVPKEDFIGPCERNGKEEKNKKRNQKRKENRKCGRKGRKKDE